MSIPAGVETVTVTDGGVAITSPDGTPLDGFFTVTGPDFATIKEDDYLFGGFARRWVMAGRFDPIELVATDASGIDPTGFTYTVNFVPRYGQAWTRYVLLPKSAPSVVLADILIPDPVAGTYTGGSSGTPASTVVPETAYGQASDVGDASAYAREDHTHGTPALPSPGAIGALPSSGGIITGDLAVAGHALGEDTPGVHGLAAWCYAPALAVNSTTLTNGTLYLVRMNIVAAVSVTKVHWWVGNSGSSPSSNQNQVGIYASDGTLLTSAIVDAAISSAGPKSTTVASTPLTAGQFYWVALLFNASVPPTLTRASGWTGVEAAANLGLTPATYMYATNGTGRSALPASITPGSNTGTDIAGPWAAVGP